MLKKLSLLLCVGLLVMSGCSTNNANGAETIAGTKAETTTNSEATSVNSEATTVMTAKENYGLEQLSMPKKGEEIAVMTTSMGTIKMRLFPSVAPKAVENFTTHAKDKYYDGKIFHRVINDFMIQGGDPDGTGMGGESIWGKPFEDEFSTDYHNIRGALSMANSGENTNGSQFFIVQAKDLDDEWIPEMEKVNTDEKTKGLFAPEVVAAYKGEGGTPWLDYKHTVFGYVFEGMDVVDAIAKSDANEEGKPAKDITIDKIEIIKYEEAKK